MSSEFPMFSTAEVSHHESFSLAVLTLDRQWVLRWGGMEGGAGVFRGRFAGVGPVEGVGHGVVIVF